MHQIKGTGDPVRSMGDDTGDTQSQPRERERHAARASDPLTSRCQAVGLRRQGSGVLLLLCGLVAIGSATIGLSRGHRRAAARPVAPVATGRIAVVVDGTLVRTNGPVDVIPQRSSYLPGQAGGWHSHEGLHLVSVIASTLTVYGADCQPRFYEPGDLYIGGDEAHLARNDTTEPVEMAVTYLMPAGRRMADFRVDESAPATCPAGENRNPTP